jgi:hypothetical protein
MNLTDLIFQSKHKRIERFSIGDVAGTGLLALESIAQKIKSGFLTGEEIVVDNTRVVIDAIPTINEIASSPHAVTTIVVDTGSFLGEEMATLAEPVVTEISNIEQEAISTTSTAANVVTQKVSDTVVDGTNNVVSGSSILAEEISNIDVPIADNIGYSNLSFENKVFVVIILSLLCLLVLLILTLALI